MSAAVAPPPPRIEVSDTSQKEAEYEDDFEDDLDKELDSFIAEKEETKDNKVNTVVLFECSKLLEKLHVLN